MTSSKDVQEALPDSEKLRYIAKSLDLLTGLLRPHFEAGRITVDGSPLSEEDNALLLEWLTGTQQQDDLRAWADKADTTRSYITELEERFERLMESHLAQSEARVSAENQRDTLQQQNDRLREALEASKRLRAVLRPLEGTYFMQSDVGQMLYLSLQAFDEALATSTTTEEECPRCHGRGVDPTSGASELAYAAPEQLCSRCGGVGTKDVKPRSDRS